MDDVRAVMDAAARSGRVVRLLRRRAGERALRGHVPGARALARPLRDLREATATPTTTTPGRQPRGRAEPRHCARGHVGLGLEPTIAPNARRGDGDVAARSDRASLSPRARATRSSMNSQVDVRDPLPSDPAPDAGPPSHGRARAEPRPGAVSRLADPGREAGRAPRRDHVPIDEPDQILDEIEEFLTGMRPARVSDRVLTTVLVSDLVGSTERATGSGMRLGPRS